MNYLVESTNIKRVGQYNRTRQTETCRGIQTAETIAREWVNSEHHDNVRVFKLDIGQEVTKYLELHK